MHCIVSFAVMCWQCFVACICRPLSDDGVVLAEPAAVFDVDADAVLYSYA